VRLAGVRVVRDARISGMLLPRERQTTGTVRITGRGVLDGRLRVRLTAAGRGQATGTLGGHRVDLAFQPRRSLGGVVHGGPAVVAEQRSGVAPAEDTPAPTRLHPSRPDHRGPGRAIRTHAMRRLDVRPQDLRDIETFLANMRAPHRARSLGMHHYGFSDFVVSTGRQS
jgi:hypothetical protein